MQTAVSATNVSCPVLDTRKLPDDDCTSAAPPVAASGEFASTLIETVPLLTVPPIVGSDGAEPDGDVGLPPHAGMKDPSAKSEIA